MPALAEYGICHRDNGRPNSRLQSQYQQQRKHDSQSRPPGQLVVVPAATSPIVLARFKSSPIDGASGIEPCVAAHRTLSSVLNLAPVRPSARAI